MDFVSEIFCLAFVCLSCVDVSWFLNLIFNIKRYDLTFFFALPCALNNTVHKMIN